MLTSRNPALTRVVGGSGGAPPKPGRAPADREPGQPQPLGDRATIEGIVYKTLGLLALTAVTTVAVWVWAGGQPVGLPFAGIAFFPLIAVAVLTGFKPHLARITAPIYAVIAGGFIGVFTLGLAAMLDAELTMLPTQAAVATLVVAGAMLVAYRTGLIKATPRLRKVVVTATIGIAGFYMVNIVLSWLGSPTGLIWGGGWLPILLSVAFIVVASLMLVLDFDLVERLAGDADKRMEWYGAFALVTTLIWLYIEMLRLLSLLLRE